MPHIVKKLATTLVLFLLVTLHVLVFALSRHPGTFISQEFEKHNLSLSLILYITAIVVSCLHQPITRWLGLRKTLSAGLFCNVIALSLIVLHHYWLEKTGGVLLYLTTLFFGVASLSVLNCLITYIFLEFPKKTILAIAALFSFANGGLMLAPVLALHVGTRIGLIPAFAALLALQLLFIWFVHFLFIEPPLPQHHEHLRSGSLIWREMHHRLALYILAIIFFSMTENTFAHWGAAYVRDLFNPFIGYDANAFFWMSMILSQLLLLVPIYFIDPMKVFFYLIGFIVVGLVLVPLQQSLGAIHFSLVIGGFGCSLIFPIVLSVLEMEIIRTALLQDKVHFLPLIETAISFMMAGYMFGAGVINFWIEYAPSAIPSQHFYLAIPLILSTAGIIWYLHRTRLAFK